MKTKLYSFTLAALAGVALLGATGARAVDFHVATAQDLQNALTLAANNGANNNIYLTNGYYIGNFNYNSAAGYNLTITNEPGVSNTQITLDGGGNGRDLSITSSGTGSNTVSGLTFSRNCGNSGIGALRIAGGAGSVILVNGCQFLSPTNTSGIGLELASGLNATATNCFVSGTTIGGGGNGISISGVTGNVIVQNCTINTNSGGIGISGAGVIMVAGSVFTSNSGSGASCSGTTITLSGNSFIGNFGGATCSGTTITLTGNTFITNSSPWPSPGGGAYCSGTTITLNGNTFTANSANGYTGGGGAYCSGTTITLNGNLFVGNSAINQPPALGQYGGGALCSGTTIILMRNTFTANLADNGGGAYCSGTVMLTNNTFSGNSASFGSGGGVCCSASGTNLTAFGNTFQQNNAQTGGGIYASGQTLYLLDNLAVNNSQTTSGSQGGGVWVDATSNLFFINNTITGNTAAGSGGGAAFEVTGTVELLNVFNNIIWGNTANTGGGDVWVAGQGQKKIFNFNDADSYYGVWDIAVNNKDLSPQFFDPVNGDYHIQSTSPCKDAGTNGAPSLPATDLDGGPRIANGTVDLGCYEFNTTATHPADTNNDFVITPAEYAAYAAAWKAGQSFTNGPNPIQANYVTRAGYLMTNSSGQYHNDGSGRPVNWKTGP